MLWHLQLEALRLHRRLAKCILWSRRLPPTPTMLRHVQHGVMLKAYHRLADVDQLANLKRADGDPCEGDSVKYLADADDQLDGAQPGLACVQ